MSVAQLHSFDVGRFKCVVIRDGGHLGTASFLFTNARFMMAQAEWDFWTSESNLTKLSDIFGRFARKNLPPLIWIRNRSLPLGDAF